jgi:hypothetical protein
MQDSAMAQRATGMVKDGDPSFELRIDACRVFLGGEFAGNIEIDVACPADAVGRAVDCLRIQTPGEPASDMALGNGEYAPGVQLIFWADWSTRLQALPQQVMILWGETLIAEVTPSLEQFDHVRVYMRWHIAEGADEHDQEIWKVTLEGPIPFASTVGRVHLHDEAMPIESYSSEFTARRVAAQVAVHTGLKVLDTGHDQTA